MGIWYLALGFQRWLRGRVSGFVVKKAGSIQPAKGGSLGMQRTEITITDSYEDQLRLVLCSKRL